MKLMHSVKDKIHIQRHTFHLNILMKYKQREKNLPGVIFWIWDLVADSFQPLCSYLFFDVRKLHIRSAKGWGCGLLKIILCHVVTDFLLNIKMHVTQLLLNARSILNQGLPNKFLGKLNLLTYILNLL